MKLTRAQRALLFAGTPPKITFDGKKPCPIPVGHVEVLSAHVRLEVTGHRRTKQGEHALIYTLHNNRLGQRFLAKQDGQAHPEQYVSSGSGGIDSEAGEAVDEFTQRRITEDARRREVEAAGELIAAAEAVRQALKDRIETNPDFQKMAGRSIWRLRSELDRLIRNQRNKAA